MPAEQSNLQMISIVGPIAIAIAIASLAILVRQRRRSTITVDRDRVVNAQAAWTAPDGLANASLPRAVKFTGIAWFVFAVAVLFVVGSGVAGWFISRNAERDRETAELLQREGIAVQGSITRKWRGGGRSNSHNVAYTYTAPDGVHSASAQVTTSFYNRVGPGAPARVIYAPSNPGVHQIESGIPTPAWLKYTVFFPLAVFLVIPFIVWRQRSLLEYGTPAGAVVERVAPMKGGWMITYQFLGASGDTVKGRCSVSVKPNAGDTITVVYDPERPKRSARYPLKYVTLEDAL
jgi:hypothetical protein